MTFEKRVNKEKAIVLRQLGWKYDQIAKELDCSKEWCCANLKGVEPDLEMMRGAAKFYMGWE